MDLQTSLHSDPDLIQNNGRYQDGCRVLRLACKDFHYIVVLKQQLGVGNIGGDVVLYKLF